MGVSLINERASGSCGRSWGVGDKSGEQTRARARTQAKVCAQAWAWADTKVGLSWQAKYLRHGSTHVRNITEKSKSA